jgi:hypothetical protein
MNWNSSQHFTNVTLFCSCFKFTKFSQFRKQDTNSNICQWMFLGCVVVLPCPSSKSTGQRLNFSTPVPIQCSAITPPSTALHFDILKSQISCGLSTECVWILCDATWTSKVTGGGGGVLKGSRICHGNTEEDRIWCISWRSLQELQGHSRGLAVIRFVKNAGGPSLDNTSSCPGKF